MKKILCILLCLALSVFGLCGCGKEESKKDTNTDADSAVQSQAHQKVKVTMQDGGEFTIELYPEYAPETCENFINLVESGFYNGLTFHRVIDGFMAQGGSTDGVGIKGSDKTIKGEFSANGFSQNTLSHQRGVVSMARAASYDSASSQFFICYGDCTFLDGQYAGFGKVVDGMEVVDSFLKVERTQNSSGELATPVNPIVIKSMEVI